MIRAKIVWVVFSLVSVLVANELSAMGMVSTAGLVKERREVSDFKDITISGSSNLYIKQGTKEALTIEGDSRILSEIQTEVKDHHLFLSPKDHGFNIDNPINYYLTVKEIQNINTSGNISVSARSNLVSPQLNLIMDGSGKADIKVKVNQLNIKIAGSGNVTVSGTAQDQIIQIEGSGEVNGKKLSGDKVAITISGSGIAEVNPSQELDVKIYGFGKVKYYGRPKITQEISGGGEIIPL